MSGCRGTSTGQVELQAERFELRCLSRQEKTVDGQQRRFAACGGVATSSPTAKPVGRGGCTNGTPRHDRRLELHLKAHPAFTGGLWMPMACNSMLPSTHLTARAPNASAGSWSKMPRDGSHT